MENLNFEFTDVKHIEYKFKATPENLDGEEIVLHLLNL